MRALLVLLLALTSAAYADGPFTRSRVTATGTSSSGGTTTPGGSTGQVQYNNAGSFGGVTGLLTSGTDVNLVRLNSTTVASDTQQIYQRCDAGVCRLDGAQGNRYYAASNAVQMDRLIVSASSAFITPTALLEVYPSGTQAGISATSIYVTSTVGTISSTFINGNTASITTVNGTTGTFTNVAGTLTTAAQPSITSLGALTALTVNGTASVTTISATAGTLSGLTMAGQVTGTTITLTGNLTTNLSANRIPFIGSGGVLSASSNFLFLSSGVNNRVTVNSTVVGNQVFNVSGTANITSWTSIGGAATPTTPFAVIGMATSAGLAYACVDGVGNITSSTTTCTVSDKNLKVNIQPMGDALAKTMALRPVTFNWRTNPKGVPQYGLVAQEVEKVIPQLVATGTDGTKSVDYAKLSVLLLGALQTQQTQINALQQGR